MVRSAERQGIAAKTTVRLLLQRPAILAAGAVSVGWVFFSSSHWIFTVSSALLLAVNALGLMVLVGWAREISLVQGALVGTAVYLTGWMYRPNLGGLGLPYPVAVIVAIAIVALLCGIPAFATARLSGIYVMVLTLALQFTIERGLFGQQFLTYGADPVSVPTPWIFGWRLDSDRDFYFFILGVLGLVMLCLARLRHSRYGRSLLLVGSDREVAAAMGVSPWRYKTYAFLICGVLAGLAGAISAPLFVSPPYPDHYVSFTSLYFLAIPVLAGFESSTAVVAVALTFTVIPHALQSWHIHSFILAGLGLMAGTALGARGLGGLVLDRWRFVRRRTWRARQPIVTIVEPEPMSAACASAAFTWDEKRSRALEALERYLPPPGSQPVALDVSHVALAFGGVKALQGVSLRVPTGQFVGLIGPNGAGKSTLFDIVNGLKAPDSGSIHLFGQDITRLRPWQRTELGMSRTFQSSRLNLDLPVSDNLLSGAHRMVKGSLPGVLVGWPGAWSGMRRAEEAAWAVAELFDLDDQWDELAGALSFGNRRRIEIGRSLLAAPRLLLLDEPTAGLDPRSAAVLTAFLRRLQCDLGLTMLLVDHYVRVVIENCELIHVLSQGHLVVSGTPEEVAAHPEVRAQYLGIGSAVGLAGASSSGPRPGVGP